MNVQEAIATTYLKASGKTTTLTTGSKFQKIVGLLDFYQRAWAKTKDVDWNSLYNPAFSLGTVTATDTFDLDSSSIRTLSSREGDSVRIVHSDGVGYTDYTIVDANRLKDYSYGVHAESPFRYYVAQIGSQIKFNHTFISTDPQHGGEIFVPCYTFADPIVSTSLNDDIQVDDPDWLVLRCAAEYVRTDLTRQGQYNNLLAEANEALERMVEDNSGQSDTIYMPWTPFGSNNESAWS